MNSPLRNSAAASLTKSQDETLPRRLPPIGGKGTRSCSNAEAPRSSPLKKQTARARSTPQSTLSGGPRMLCPKPPLKAPPSRSRGSTPRRPSTLRASTLKLLAQTRSSSPPRRARPASARTRTFPPRISPCTRTGPSLLQQHRHSRTLPFLTLRLTPPVATTSPTCRLATHSLHPQARSTRHTTRRHNIRSTRLSSRTSRLLPMLGPQQAEQAVRRLLLKNVQNNRSDQKRPSTDGKRRASEGRQCKFLLRAAGRKTQGTTTLWTVAGRNSAGLDHARAHSTGLLRLPRSLAFQPRRAHLELGERTSARPK